MFSAHAHTTLSPDTDRRRLAFGLALLVAFIAAEVTAGLISGSLALLSDAGHMLTDAGALALSLLVIRLAARPAEGGLTYGLKRAEVLSGLANGVTLVAIGALVIYEAIRRLVSPASVDARYMLAVALVGMAVNLVVVWQLAGADQRSLNIRGSYGHILTDLYALIGTAAAAVVILITGFVRADPIISILVAMLMLRAGYGLLSEAGRTLLEAAPRGLDPAEIAGAITAHPSVANVHDLHVWEITAGFPALSAHVLVRPDDDCHGVRRELEHVLARRFHIEHTTLQVDHIHEHHPITIG